MTSAGPRFRRDIEGLRAVAVLLVLIYHAGLPLPHGLLGVDVFFVISGYLITGILLRELTRTGSIDWPAFAARRVRRLLPAAGLVLVATALGAWLLVPGLRRQSIGVDLIAAATYVINWVLADRAVDYLSADAVASPVQHFWSLAVEEQFYIVWPLLLIAVGWGVRRLRGRTPHGGDALFVIAALTVASFGYAVWAAQHDPKSAYFVSTTRFWELGVGAGLACVVARGTAAAWLARRPRLVAGVTWVAAAAIVLPAVAVPTSAAWPSWWTLPPTLGAAALLLAGLNGPVGVARLLSSRAMVFIGGLSYSLYLWHWPVLTLSEWAWGPLPLLTKVALTVGSAIPAYASWRWVERPVMRSPRLASNTRRTLVLGAVLSVTGVLAGVPLTQVTSPFVTTPASGALPPVTALGANTLTDPPSTDLGDYPTPDWMTPDPESAGTDRPAADVDHCQVEEVAVAPVACVFGARDGATTIALVGDSKAMQWLPAVEAVASTHDWRIITYGKSSCRFGDGHAALGGRAYPACDTWSDAVAAELLRIQPDVVVTAGFANRGWAGSSATADAAVDALAQRWSALVQAGIPVVPVIDNPASPRDLDICAARHPTDVQTCAFDRESAIAASGAAVDRLAAQRAGLTPLDLTDQLCPTARCPVVIGHVTVHRAGAHITATYARTLAARFESAVVQRLR